MQRAVRTGNSQPRRRFALELPVRTLLKGLAAALLTVCVVKLWPELQLLLMSLLLALALAPLVDWLGRHRVKRSLAIGLISVLGLGLIAAFVGLVVPPTVTQVSELLEDLPGLMGKLESALPENPVIKSLTGEVSKFADSPDALKKLGEPVKLGKSALSGLATFGIALVVTVYLLADGRRVWAWLLAFAPRRHREKAAQTADGVTAVVHEYVRGQGLTSLACTVFTGIVLTVFEVPAALPLAVLAGLCDIIPVVGFVVATVPAVLLALTVSPTAGIAVAALYVGYQLFESYVLIPRVYGKMMRLSTLTVVLAFLIGGALQGIWGAVMALPLVAAYPVIERIWLRRQVGEETLADHHALDETEGKANEKAVEAVMNGDPRTGAMQ